MKLVLIDGNSILNRAYYALPFLNDGNQHNVNAVYGFTSILLKVLSDYKPSHLIVTFDKRGHNFRKDLYAEYKANRAGMPDDLAQQMPVLHDLLDTMNIAVVEKAGVEADDIIGTLSLKLNMPSLVVTGDRDMLQLVSDDLTVLLTKRGVTDVERVTPETLKENYGLTPLKVIEYKALRGDTSDNIPGVKGIGEKTAMDLLSKFNDIDDLYANLDSVKGALRTKLEEGKEMAYVSKKLATIIRNADVDCTLEKCVVPQFGEKVRDKLLSLQFRSLLSRLNFADSPQSEQPEPVDCRCEEVTQPDRLKEIVKDLCQKPSVALCYDGGWYLSGSADAEYKIVESDSFLGGFTQFDAVMLLKPLFECSCDKIVYDGKSLKHRLEPFDVVLNNVVYDVDLMQYLALPRAYKNQKALTESYNLKGTVAPLFTVKDLLYKQLEQTETLRLYREVELPLSDVLYEMEKQGVCVDTELLEKLSVQFSAKINEIAEDIYRLAGKKFNVASPKQLSEVLFVNLGLKHYKKTATGYSTNNEVLEKLRGSHPIIEKIMEYRQWSKLAGTYIDGLRPLVKKGKVHTTYNQSLTTTGRLSSSDPNLQNIPIRNDLGKEIRKLFVSQYGVFVGADYSQIELRLLAAFSHDANLLESFNKGEDIHAKVASEIMGVPLEMVNSSMRRMAKAVNFGIIYGISDYGLSENTGISFSQAHDYIQRYFNRFPAIKSYLDNSVESARKNGYVTTITGRRRYIPELNATDKNVRAFGERASMNMPLQGSAADIMKIAMLKVDEEIRRLGLRSRMVMQIHDELIVDCFEEEADQVEEILKRQMENAFNLDCKLTVETERGRNLYEV